MYCSPDRGQNREMLPKNGKNLEIGNMKNQTSRIKVNILTILGASVWLEIRDSFGILNLSKCQGIEPSRLLHAPIVVGDQSNTNSENAKYLATHNL